MSKGDNRLKILYVIDILKKNSQSKGVDDKNRFISATDIIKTLNDEYELKADRKSVYSYIDSLEKYGFAIDRCKKGYYLLGYFGSGTDDDTFETAELKMLVDALVLSRFYPVRKTRQAIRKLEHLIPNGSQVLQNREIFLEKVIKSDNLSVIYNIGSIHEAIIADKQIAFHYQSVDVDLKSSPKKLVTSLRTENGHNKQYIQSPYALLWKNEYYYLLCYDSDMKDARTFRVDRMADVIVQNGEDGIPDKKREGHKFFSSVDIAEYVNTAFSMFKGEKRNVSLRVKKSLAKVIVDYFGKNISVYSDDFDDDYFLCSVEVQNSHMFFSWLSGFNNDIQIKFPNDIRDEYVEYLGSIISGYEELKMKESDSTAHK